jgi:putative CocE/NonD family hydrolase
MSGLQPLPVVERNLLIPVSFGATLAADLFRPAGEGKFPALISLYPYHKDDFIGAMNDMPMRYLASQSYAQLLVDFRGTGGSSGIAWEAADPGEGRDGAEVVEWVAQQPWCDGKVGMWGLSYGAVTAIKTAAEAPPHLRAIVPIMGTADPYHGFGHIGGCANCLGADGEWGSFMLAMNLMPPTNPDPLGRWYQVWMERLEHGKPCVLPWLEHPYYDEYWRTKTVDPQTITTPTFVVGGWHDVFVDAMPAIYARLSGPKKLLMGPWMHGMPDMAASEPIEFLPMMRRWFDHWLKGDANLIAYEPPVTIYVQRGEGWRNEPAWPIERTTMATWFLGDGGSLHETDHQPAGEATYSVDPTVGTCAGLWDPISLGVGMLVDQGPDDLRSLTYTSMPLERDMELTGTGTATIYAALLAGTDGMIAAKLCDVDPSGASSLITTGLLLASHRLGSDQKAPVTPSEIYPFQLNFVSTAYRLQRGHRLRLSISGADFPHVWPSCDNGQWRVPHGDAHPSSVTLPVVPPAVVPVAGPSLQPAPRRSRPGVMTPRLKIETDLVADSVSVVTGSKGASPLAVSGATLELDRIAMARVFRARPDQTTVEGETTIRCNVPALGKLEVKTTSWFSRGRFALNGRVLLDGRVMFDRTWRPVA